MNGIHCMKFGIYQGKSTEKYEIEWKQDAMLIANENVAGYESDVGMESSTEVVNRMWSVVQEL